VLTPAAANLERLHRVPRHVPERTPPHANSSRLPASFPWLSWTIQIDKLSTPSVPRISCTRARASHSSFLVNVTPYSLSSRSTATGQWGRPRVPIPILPGSPLRPMCMNIGPSNAMPNATSLSRLSRRNGCLPWRPRTGAARCAPSIESLPEGATTTAISFSSAPSPDPRTSGSYVYL